MSAAFAIARALRGKSISGGYLVRCPVPSHGNGKGDRNPSLLVRDGDKAGRVLVHCYAGCAADDILAELRRRNLLNHCCDDQAYSPASNSAPPQHVPDPEALAIWRSGRTIAADHPAARFLTARGLTASAPPSLFGASFKSESWAAWHSFLAAVFGLPLDADALATYRECTARDMPPPGGHREAWIVSGRRSGKSHTMAVVGCYLAAFHDWSAKLSPGEVGTVMILASDRRQAGVIMGYCRALLAAPMLRGLVLNQTQESIELKGNIAIEVHAASFRGVRGRTLCCAIADEIAFWRSDETSANPDQEIMRALRPALATTGGYLIAASSPYARRGELFRAYERHYGRDSRVLVWKAPSRTMNPSLPQSVIDRAMEDDAEAAKAEYLAEFRSDLEIFVKLETVTDCLGGYIERAPDSSMVYKAFCDPSGGSSDSFTLAIGHRERDQVHVDAVYAKQPPFSPSQVVDEFAQILHNYRVHTVVGDAYAGTFPRELFARHSIQYRVAPLNRTQLYQSLLPLLNSARITLPRSDKLVKELVGLERRVSRAGRELIDHGVSGHDDLANSCAGVAYECRANTAPMPVFSTWGMTDDKPQRTKKFDGVIESGPLAGGFASST
jgi:hypothetical protein